MGHFLNPHRSARSYPSQSQSESQSQSQSQPYSTHQNHPHPIPGTATATATANISSIGSISTTATVPFPFNPSHLHLHQHQQQQFQARQAAVGTAGIVAPPHINLTAVANPASVAPEGGSSFSPRTIDASRNMLPPQHLTAEAVAALPPPGLSGPSSLVFSPKYNDQQCGRYLAFVSSSFARRSIRAPPNNNTSTSSTTNISNFATNMTGTPLSPTPTTATTSERQLYVIDFTQQQPLSPQPLLRLPNKVASKRRMLDDHTSFPTSNNTASPIGGSTETAAIATSTTVNITTSPSAVGSTLTSSPSTSSGMSIEERVRRERQKMHASTGSLVQFSWCPVSALPMITRATTATAELKSPETATPTSSTTVQQMGTSTPTETVNSSLRLLVPIRGSLYIQNGVLDEAQHMELVYDRTEKGDAVDPQLSPDGTMISFCVSGDIYVRPATPSSQAAVRLTFGASPCISHGLADFVAQEEMDRYRGYWWHPNSQGILFARLDESKVPPYRIIHQDSSAVALAPTTTAMTSASQDDPCNNNNGVDGTNTAPASSSCTCSNANGTMAAAFEDHRYPFAGKENPSVKLGYVNVDRNVIFREGNYQKHHVPIHITARKLNELDTNVTSASTDVNVNDMDSTLQNNFFNVDGIALENWNSVKWFDPPREAPEYLARVSWLPDGSACVQWQNRTQTTLVLMRLDLQSKKARTLLVERSDVWINLNHMMKVLPYAVHPDACCGVERNISPVPNPLPDGSFSFLFASERTGYCHLYLYTFVPGYNGEQAVLIRAISGREWIVENIVGIDMKKDLVYFTGTYDSVLERHLYALPITNSRAHVSFIGDIGGDGAEENGLSTGYLDQNHHSVVNPNGVRRGLKQVMNALSGKSSRQRSHDYNSIRPIRLTVEAGMHNIIMDDDCRLFVDTSSDLNRPTTVKIYELPDDFPSFAMTNGGVSSWSSTRGSKVRLLFTLYDAVHEDKSLIALADTAGTGSNSSVHANDLIISSLPAPEFLSFPTSDGSETLHAALYRPDPRVHGPGPYPLICAVYGGPNVQRVNRSWSQCADMRAQRLRSFGFCVVKCDNRGSSRRGLAFESAISRRLGRLEVLDQVAAVRQLTLRGIADPTRVGIYGWSYGGYLAAMCLCRAPDVFHVAVAGAPVTSWDGYDTHYTERYMGLPSENPTGYREAAVFDHVPNMRGQLMIVHGLIDENVHFRHTARLINRLIASGKDYDLLLFPDERHSPRRLRDRIYMEQRISNYFLRNLGGGVGNLTSIDSSRINAPSVRPVAGHL